MTREEILRVQNDITLPNGHIDSYILATTIVQLQHRIDELEEKVQLKDIKGT